MKLWGTIYTPESVNDRLTYCCWVQGGRSAGPCPAHLQGPVRGGHPGRRGHPRVGQEGNRGGCCCRLMILGEIQGDQLDIVVCFWYLVKSDQYTHRTHVHWTSRFLQGSRNTQLCVSGHPVGKIVGGAVVD